MLCLHGEEAGTSTTKKGTFWYCKQDDSPCHFLCSEDNADLYDKAVKKFLSTKQGRPKCCAVNMPVQRTLVNDGGNVKIPEPKVKRNYAKMLVVTDPKKESFGRPFFACSKRKEWCNYFAWGDQTIVERPLCEHGKPSWLLTVKKEGPNKDRKFFACGEHVENQCHFFEWFREEPEDPLLPVVRRGNTVYTQSFWSSFYTTGEKKKDREEC